MDDEFERMAKSIEEMLPADYREGGKFDPFKDVVLVTERVGSGVHIVRVAGPEYPYYAVGKGMVAEKVGPGVHVFHRTGELNYTGKTFSTDGRNIYIDHCPEKTPRPCQEIVFEEPVLDDLVFEEPMFER